jgi:hypothetical protein
MKTLTPQQIVDLNPCRGYDLEWIKKLFGNKKSVTYLEILDTDKIPLADIVWVFCRSTMLDADIRNQWLEVIITRAVTNYALHCGIDTVEKWAKNWLNGDDRTVVAARAAGYAARTATNAGYNAVDAAYNAAHVAAYAADATAYASNYTAVYAADAAARDAAEAAADTAVRAGYDAAYAACKTERKQQIQDLKDILQG